MALGPVQFVAYGFDSFTAVGFVIELQHDQLTAVVLGQQQQVEDPDGAICFEAIQLIEDLSSEPIDPTQPVIECHPARD